MLVVFSLQFNLKKDGLRWERFCFPQAEPRQIRGPSDMWCPRSSCNLAKVFEPTTHKGNSIRATWAMSVLQTLATWRRPFIVYCVTSALKIVLAKVKAGAWSFKLKRVLQACVGPRHSDICPRHPSCIPTYLAQLRGQKQYAIEIDVADAFVFRRMPIQCKGWSR